MKKPLLSLLPPVHPASPVQASKFRGSRVPRFSRHRFNLLAVLTLLTISATGCQVLTYSSPTGERFTRSSLGANTSIHSLSVETGTNGIRKVQLRGYQNNETEALGSVTEAAVRAAIQGAK